MKSSVLHFFIISSWVLRMRSVSDKFIEKIKTHVLWFGQKFIENQNTHFMFHNYFRKLVRLWYNVEKFCAAGQATDENMAHTHCMLDTTGYKRTLTKCNTYCFSTPTIFARKRLNITLYVHFFSWSGAVNVVILMLCHSWVCYNERCYDKWMLQRTIFINNIRMLQWTQTLQRKRRYTTGRRSTHMHLTCRAFPLCLTYGTGDLHLNFSTPCM
jgi:hypothetical protein